MQSVYLATLTIDLNEHLRTLLKGGGSTVHLQSIAQLDCSPMLCHLLQDLLGGLYLP